MKILVTNDDGINAEGLRYLVDFAKKLGDVIVVSPKFEQSAMSHALKIVEPFECIKVDKGFGVDTYSVDSTPADCVRYAHYGLEEKIDVVLSGINRGYNLGEDIMYSGTCGACVQASLSKIPSIAFSVKNKDYFHQIDKYAKKVLDYIFDNDLLDSSYFLNVNIPEGKSKGIKLTKVYGPIYETYYPILIDSETNKYIIERKAINEINNEDCDKVAINNGYISLTVLSQNLFKDELYKKVEEKLV